MNTKAITTWQIEGEETAIQAAGELIRRSAWFDVEPRPFNWYSFSVKAGEGHEIALNILRKAPRGKQ